MAAATMMTTLMVTVACLALALVSVTASVSERLRVCRLRVCARAPASAFCTSVRPCVSASLHAQTIHIR
eukprot:7590099-Lingulodinium_polyedra.AAC.1